MEKINFYFAKLTFTPYSTIILSNYTAIRRIGIFSRRFALPAGFYMEDKVALFFDSVAEDWDVKNNLDSEVLEKITDISGASENKTVLDAGCGTGVLIPFFLKRKVGHVTALDISEKMLRIAQRKYSDKRISFVCSNILSFNPDEKFDCVMVHNAFPHFLSQRQSIEKLKELTDYGGTLTIAHSISRDAVLRCHENVPEISVELPKAQTVADMLGDEFEKFTLISDEKCYIVSAARKKSEE